MSAFRMTFKNLSKINLDDLGAGVKAIESSYVGYAAGHDGTGRGEIKELRLSFDSIPSGANQTAISTYVNSIDSDSDEKKRYVTSKQINDRLLIRKMELLTKEWTDMSIFQA